MLLTVDHHRGSEENQAGWEHHDPTRGRPPHRAHGHPALGPAGHRGRRAGGPRGAGGGRRRRPWPRCGRRRWPCCSSTAATGRTWPGRTTGPGRRRWPPAATWPSTTCSPIRPTAGGRRTSCTAPPSASGEWTEEAALGLRQPAGALPPPGATVGQPPRAGARSERAARPGGAGSARPATGGCAGRSGSAAGAGRPR